MNWKKLFSMFSTRSDPVAPSVEDITDSMRSEIRMDIRADSVNESERSVEAIATTGNPVEVFDTTYWEVVDEILVPDGGSFPDEMSMLDSHKRESVKNVLGGVSKARMIDNGWLVKLTFDEGSDAEDAFRKVRKRFIRDVSLGYRVDMEAAVYIQKGMTANVNGREYTASEKRMLKVCPKWQANEVSPTPIGADKDAKIRAAVVMYGDQKTQKRCDELAAELDDLIVDTGLPRDEVIGDMASAAGISAGDVNEILTGDVAPSSDQLDGFAAALETDTEPLAQLI